MDKLIVAWLCFVSGISTYFFLEICAVSSSNVQYFQIGNSNVSVKRIQPIENAYNQCYVNVIVHNSSSHHYGLANATVTVLSGKTKEFSQFEYTGFAQGQTDSNGSICLIVYCHNEGMIFVEKNDLRIFSVSKDDQQKHLPQYFKVDIRNNNEIVHFYSYVWGTINGHMGPVYTNAEKGMCQTANTNDSHFAFSYISIPDKLVSTPVPTISTDPTVDETWYYSISGSVEKTCYLKLSVQTKSTQLTVYGTSRLNNPSGKVLGIYEAGLQYDISSNDITSKAVCMEFRCPAQTIFSQPMNTHVQGYITDASGGRLSCCPVLKKENKLYNVQTSSFSGTFVDGNKYGPADGVYMGATKQMARARCYTGHDYLGHEYSMDVHQGYAIEYDCTKTCPSSPSFG